ncbi:MAG: DUF5103 domain-containing protein [Bacteroidales bacterium]|nr:DUF5103 domain-containing protein [Bacteroidales bacterium]
MNKMKIHHNRNIPVLILASFILGFLWNNPVQCQHPYQDTDGKLREMALDPNVKTIQLYREGWPLSYPVIRLPEDVPLVLEFDDLSKDQPTFLYKVVHCNADWTPSGLIEQEYLEGYPENEVPGSTPSFNTYYTYRHYTLNLPNENTRFLVSGNYMVVVYRDWDPGDVAFTKRFMVTEGLVNIQARAGIPVMNHYKGCCHEVDFTVKHAGVNIDDPFGDTRAAIYQNGLWDLGLEGLQPYMVNPLELVYDFQEENIFPGGNEFRFFDTKNTRIPTYFIQHIDYIDPYFHFELKPDKPNPPHLYFSKEDINGRYFIESEGGRDPGVDADYVFVHFSLTMPNPLDGSVYITGDLTNWQFNDLNRMEYVADKGAYMKTLLLKQGVYNYRYLFLPAFSEQFDMAEIEGSHYETENEYLILFYHRPPGTRYDRLLGHQVIHSNQ